MAELCQNNTGLASACLEGGIHFLERFFGTTPKGLTVKVEKGEDRSGPAVQPTVQSLVMYSLMTGGPDIADWKFGSCLVMYGPM